jgi:SAM-dependent methyltransferase
MFTANIDHIIRPALNYLEETDYAAKPEDYSSDELIGMYWQYHQRFKTFKNFSKKNDAILDVGGGSGGINFWKEYLTPLRSDMEIYAVDLSKGEYFDHYKDFKLINLDTDEIPFEKEKFGFIIISHLIEHVMDWKNLIDQCDNVLNTNGFLYIETPSLHTTNLPARSHYVEKGYNCSTLNFYDDPTHINPVNLDVVSAYCEAKNMIPLEKGYCKNPFLEDFLLTTGIRQNNPELTTYGLWSKLLFSSYIILQKSPKNESAP